MRTNSFGPGLHAQAKQRAQVGLHPAVVAHKESMQRSGSVAPGGQQAQGFHAAGPDGSGSLPQQFGAAAGGTAAPRAAGQGVAQPVNPALATMALNQLKMKPVKA